MPLTERQSDTSKEASRVVNKRQCGSCEKEKHIRYFPFVNPYDASDFRRWDFCVPCFSLFLKNNKNHPAFKVYSKRKQRYRYDESDPVNVVWTAIRRALEVKAMPAWANKMKIADIYIQANNLKVMTGIDYHVDHIVPLNHPLVCGLHVPDNLQILTAEDNMRKSNRFEVC